MKFKFTIFLFIFSVLKAFNIYPQVSINSTDELLQLAYRNSPDILLSREYFLTKLKGSNYSLTSFLPQLNVSWQEYDRIIKNQNDTRIKTITAEINQLVFDNGKSKLQYLYQRHNSLTEYLNNEKHIKEYEFDLIEKFYRHILLRKSYEIKKEFLNKTQSDFNIIEYKYNNGLALKSDTIQYQILIKQIENELTSIQNQIDFNLIELKNNLDIPWDCNLEINSNDFNDTNKNLELKTKESVIIEKILSSDLELTNLKNQLSYQKQMLKLSNRFYIPSVYLSGGISFSGSNYPLTQPDYSIKLIFSFDNIPFNNTQVSTKGTFNNIDSKTLTNDITTQFIPELNYFQNKKLSQLSLKQIENQLLQKEKQLKLEIIQYINQHDFLLSQEEQLNETIKLMEEKLLISEYQKDNGYITQSDFITEQLELSDTKLKLIQTVIEKKLLFEKINYFSGGNYLYE